uniref:BZIP domain-containing protein n=1 Tax=Rhabditophanes sp. KR3021 TaxID=114890 RepID=A0AC35UD49_9BILA
MLHNTQPNPNFYGMSSGLNFYTPNGLEASPPMATYSGNNMAYDTFSYPMTNHFMGMQPFPETPTLGGGKILGKENDPKYRERRDKNNEAAKLSRSKRKERENELNSQLIEVKQKLALSESQNASLLKELKLLKTNNIQIKEQLQLLQNNSKMMEMPCGVEFENNENYYANQNMFNMKQ